MSNLLDELAGIKAFIFDIDGVLTTGSVLVTEEGHMLRSVNIKDGYAIQHAVKQGIKIAFISGGNSKGMISRLQGLGVEHIFMGQKHKTEAYEQLKATWSVTDEQVCYMGDDMPDIAVLSKVGLSACPADACTDVKKTCRYISPIAGGQGCTRELLETYLKLKNLWYNDDSHTW